MAANLPAERRKMALAFRSGVRGGQRAFVRAYAYEGGWSANLAHV